MLRQSTIVVRPPPVPQPFITDVTLAGLNQSGAPGFVGMEVLIYGDPIVATALGRWVLPQNTAVCPLSLCDVNGNALSTVNLDMSASPKNQFDYVNLNPRVPLDANTFYYVWLQVFGGMDPSAQWLDVNVINSWSSAGRCRLAFGNQTDGQWDRVYVPVNFLYL